MQSCVWFLSLRLMFLKLIENQHATVEVLACCSVNQHLIAFLMTQLYSIVCMCYALFIYWWTFGFYFLTMLQYKHLSINSYVDECFHFSWGYT